MTGKDKIGRTLILKIVNGLTFGQCGAIPTVIPFINFALRRSPTLISTVEPR